MSRNDNNYLTGKLLLATPVLQDPRFLRAVVLLCSHDHNGAMGIVINHSIESFDFRDLVGKMGISFDYDDKNEGYSNRNITVMGGGPVDPARGFLIHSDDFKEADTIIINESFGVTGTVQGLQKIAEGHSQPQDMIFALGYAGWQSGQLEEEIVNNSWLVTDFNYDIVFKESPENKWRKCLEQMKIDPAMLAVSSGHA